MKTKLEAAAFPPVPVKPLKPWEIYEQVRASTPNSRSCVVHAHDHSAGWGVAPQVRGRTQAAQEQRLGLSRKRIFRLPISAQGRFQPFNPLNHQPITINQPMIPSQNTTAGRARPKSKRDRFREHQSTVSEPSIPSQNGLRPGAKFWRHDLSGHKQRPFGKAVQP